MGARIAQRQSISLIGWGSPVQIRLCAPHVISKGGCKIIVIQNGTACRVSFNGYESVERSLGYDGKSSSGIKRDYPCQGKFLLRPGASRCDGPCGRVAGSNPALPSIDLGRGVAQ